MSGRRLGGKVAEFGRRLEVIDLEMLGLAVVHRNIEGLAAEAVAEAHRKDLEVQDERGVNCIKYWFNEEKGEVFCLVKAPNEEAADAVHREAHCLVADEIMEVREGTERRLRPRLRN